jgi:hypothetical protein
VRGWSFVINILFLELIIKRLTSTLYVIIYYYRDTMLDQEIKWVTIVYVFFMLSISIARSNEILGWEGVGNRQLLCFFTA